MLLCKDSNGPFLSAISRAHGLSENFLSATTFDSGVCLRATKSARRQLKALPTLVKHPSLEPLAEKRAGFNPLSPPLLRASRFRRTLSTAAHETGELLFVVVAVKGETVDDETSPYVLQLADVLAAL